MVLLKFKIVSFNQSLVSIKLWIVQSLLLNGMFVVFRSRIMCADLNSFPVMGTLHIPLLAHDKSTNIEEHLRCSVRASLMCIFLKFHTTNSRVMLFSYKFTFQSMPEK